jgi:alanine dehydrogenase
MLALRPEVVSSLSCDGCGEVDGPAKVTFKKSGCKKLEAEMESWIAVEVVVKCKRSWERKWSHDYERKWNHEYVRKWKHE